MEWLKWSDDAAAISRESWAGVDTILMGRKTYEFAKRDSDSSNGNSDAAIGITTYIFSRTMVAAPNGANLVGDDVVAFVRALKDKPGGDIMLMCGGELGTALIEGGVVDEIGLNMHPILLGGGAPAFLPTTKFVELELKECRKIAKDCVLVRYGVMTRAEASAG